MTSARCFGGILLAISAQLAPQVTAQVQTDVPQVIQDMLFILWVGNPQDTQISKCR